MHMHICLVTQSLYICVFRYSHATFTQTQTLISSGFTINGILFANIRQVCSIPGVGVKIFILHCSKILRNSEHRVHMLDANGLTDINSFSRIHFEINNI